MMAAKFENRTLGTSHVSAHKYENLVNLPHWHMEYEFIFADCGSARVTVSSDQYMLREGHCMFIGSGEMHNIHSSPDSVISVIKIDQRLIDSAFEGRTPTCPLIETELPLLEVFSEISCELRNGQEFGSVVCDCLILKTLAHLFRSCDMRIRQVSEGNEKYKALLRMIEERCADITFAEAAKFMCYSKPYFSRYFAGITGMTFTAYLNIIRIERAVSLIHEKRFCMTEIAHAAGFGTIRHFNRVFKELTGFAPSEVPENYVFIQYRKTASSEGFDPTLSEPAIM